MKFWRRHKHELERTDGDEPLPTAPEKKMRYSREDDVLLAKYFRGRPEGTSDKIFQAFGRLVSACISFVSRFLPTMAYCWHRIHTIHGKDGRSTIGYIKQRSII